MNKSNLAIIILLALLTGCGNKISDDPKKIGKAEEEAYRFILDKLTKDMKKEFAGNMYESEKITPQETEEGVKIAIPNGTGYTFLKGNTKYIKGDINNDMKTDLVVCADMSVAFGPGSMKYFVFLQNEEGYQFSTEYQADDIVSGFCSKKKFDHGLFTLESIADGVLIGKSKFHAGDEEYFRDYSYSCELEKYKLNLKTKELELVFQSDLLKKNEKTGMNEKVDTASVVK